MGSKRETLGFVGMQICLLAFILSIPGNGWLLRIYVEERHSGCGGAVSALEIFTVIFLLVMGIPALIGYRLVSKSSFACSWWRFTRNMTLLLCGVSVFVVYARL